MARVGAEGEPQKQQAVRQTRPTNTPRRIAVISVCALVVIAAVIVLLVLFIPGQATNTDDGNGRNRGTGSTVDTPLPLRTRPSLGADLITMATRTTSREATSSFAKSSSELKTSAVVKPDTALFLRTNLGVDLITMAPRTTARESPSVFAPSASELKTSAIAKPVKPRHCADMYSFGGRIGGVKMIYPEHMEPFEAFCDQTTKGGGWTVFQKRLDGSVDFYRNWTDYKQGFGNLSGEFWLGLDKIHRLTSQTNNKLRVELEDFDGNTAYAEYDTFAVADKTDNYTLSVGNYSGTAGDSLAHHNRMAFSTKDRDNDQAGNSCAMSFKGAWWYHNCHNSNLNGLYHHGNHSSFADGVNWETWRGYQYSFKRAEMKFRPVDF